MRHIVAVMVVAGALGADRLAVSAPIRAPQLSQAVRQLADRFTGSFRSAPIDVRPQQLPHQIRCELPRALPPVEPPLPARHAQTTPFRFRLPPPAEC